MASDVRKPTACVTAQLMGLGLYGSHIAPLAVAVLIIVARNVKGWRKRAKKSHDYI